MPNLSWNEVRDRALAFSQRWAGEASEAGGKQSFWNEFFVVCGRDRRSVAAFEVAVRNLEGNTDFIDLLSRHAAGLAQDLWQKAQPWQWPLA